MAKSIRKTYVGAMSDDETWWAKRFATRKTLAKKECLKLEPGTWIQLKWKDSPDTVVLLTRKLVNEPGDITLEYWDPLDCYGSYAVHSQIVRVFPPSFNVVPPKALLI